MRLRPEAWIIGLLAAGLAFGEVAGAGAPKPTRGTAASSVYADSLAGQLRASASSWLWRRTDHYLQGRLTQGRPAAVVRSGQRSLLGRLFSDWEAGIAGRDPRRAAFRDPKDALPLFRLMTWLDPQFLPGWTAGARVISQGRTPGSLETALAFLKEGLQHNPDNPTILTEQGFLLATRKGDVVAGARAFDRAIEVARRSEDLSPWDRDALLEACRFAALLHRRTGRMDRYYEVVRFGAATFKTDPLLQRLATGPHPPLRAYGETSDR